MNNNIEIIISTLDDEFEILKEEIETIPWYKEQGYQIVSPHSQGTPHAHLHLIPRFKDVPYTGRGLSHWCKSKKNIRRDI